jgi:hypothetical protein
VARVEWDDEDTCYVARALINKAAWWWGGEVCLPFFLFLFFSFSVRGGRVR